MSNELDHTRVESIKQARADIPTREVCGPAGTICGLALLILLAALIPA